MTNVFGPNSLTHLPIGLHRHVDRILKDEDNPFTYNPFPVELPRQSNGVSIYKQETVFDYEENGALGGVRQISIPIALKYRVNPKNGNPTQVYMVSPFGRASLKLTTNDGGIPVVQDITFTGNDLITERLNPPHPLKVRLLNILQEDELREGSNFSYDPPIEFLTESPYAPYDDALTLCEDEGCREDHDSQILPNTMERFYVISDGTTVEDNFPSDSIIEMTKVTTDDGRVVFVQQPRFKHKTYVGTWKNVEDSPADPRTPYERKLIDFHLHTFYSIASTAIPYIKRDFS